MHQILLTSKKMNFQILEEINDTEEDNSELQLFDRIKTTNQTDAECTVIRNALKRNEKNWNEMLFKHFKNVKNTLFYRDKLWISDSNELKLNVIREVHDQWTVNHSNIRRTYEFVKRLYYWSEMKNSIDKYVRNCHTCKRSKASKDRYAELLNSFSISDKSWTNITMNFVIELFVNHEFNTILMIIDKFTKIHHYISCTLIDEDITVEETARLLIVHVWKLHEFSNTIVSDRESQFVSFVWKIVCCVLQINAKLSIAFHFETNEQSEIINQKMKRYLRSYCNYQQNDWSKWLSMIEFASNVITSAFAKLFVFLANYEFESRMSFDSINIENTIRKRILIKKAFDITKKMKNIWKFIKERLTNVQKSQKRHIDKSRNFSFLYKAEDMIWLFIKNVKIERSFVN
jgi:hypothetical protein